jgi:hypothetical protein
VNVPVAKTTMKNAIASVSGRSECLHSACWDTAEEDGGRALEEQNEEGLLPWENGWRARHSVDAELIQELSVTTF